MRLEELSRALREGEDTLEVSLPDTASLRALGLRRRRNRRLSTGAAAAVVALVVAAAVLTAGGVLHRADVPPQPTDPDGVKTLNGYEKRVLASYPGAFAVGGEVVIAVPPSADNPGWLARQVDGFTGRPAAIGWHGMNSLVDDGPIYSHAPDADIPDVLRTPPPDHTQVWQDSGPMHVGCRRLERVACGLFFVLDDAQRRWYTGSRIGDDAFLQPGKPMEIVPSGTLENHRWQPAAVGGMHGTRTTRVVITQRNGDRSEATVDRGRVAAGATVFWWLGESLSQPVRATAYDVRGDVVEDHRLTPCDDPVDCQTR